MKKYGPQSSEEKQLQKALSETRLHGIATNLDYLRALAAAPVAAPDARPAPDIATVLDGVNQLSDEDAALLLRRRR